MRTAAHALKGSVGNFAAKKVFEAAQPIEILGRDGNVQAAQDAYLALEDELSLFTEELRRLTKARATKVEKRSRRNGPG